MHDWAAEQQQPLRFIALPRAQKFRPGILPPGQTSCASVGASRAYAAPDCNVMGPRATNQLASGAAVYRAHALPSSKAACVNCDRYQIPQPQPNASHAEADCSCARQKPRLCFTKQLPAPSQPPPPPSPLLPVLLLPPSPRTPLSPLALTSPLWRVLRQRLCPARLARRLELSSSCTLAVLCVHRHRHACG